MPVTIKGPNLKDLFQQANDKIIINTEDALDIVANLTQSDAKDNCPVDTGALQADITIYSAKLDRQIGNNLPYGIFVHNGTYKMRARPYLLNAFEANRQSLVQELQNMSI
jgi:HK97 gp10 family phage protein